MPVADFRDIFGRQPQIAEAIIDENEIVARAVHLRETQHGQLVTTIFRQSQIRGSCPRPLRVLSVLPDLEALRENRPSSGIRLRGSTCPFRADRTGPL